MLQIIHLLKNIFLFAPYNPCIIYKTSCPVELTNNLTLSLDALEEGGCGNCRSNNRIGDWNISKAKLRGAKYPREKTKTKMFFSLYCHVAKLLLSEMYMAYIVRVSVSYMTTVG